MIEFQIDSLKIVDFRGQLKLRVKLHSRARSAFALVPTFMIWLQCDYTPGMLLQESSAWLNFRMFAWKLWILDGKWIWGLNPGHLNSRKTRARSAFALIPLFMIRLQCYYTVAERVNFMIEFLNDSLKIVDFRGKLKLRVKLHMCARSAFALVPTCMIRLQCDYTPGMWMWMWICEF